MLDKNAGRLSLIPKVIFVDGRDEVTNVAVEVALNYNDGYSEHIYSYVNNINTIEGGTHVTGFRRALTRVFKAYGDKEGLFERAKVEIEGDDFREGLEHDHFGQGSEPQFEGQTKTKLGNNEVSGVVEYHRQPRRLDSLPGRKSQGSQEHDPEGHPGGPGEGRGRKRRGNWYSGKAYLAGAGFRVSWPIARTAIRNAASCSWSKGIRGRYGQARQGPQLPGYTALAG